MSVTYAAVYSVVLPPAAQVVDPFHAISLANRCLDAVRRRVQTEQTGDRGRRDDPSIEPPGSLHGRRSPDDQATARLASLLELGNPGAEWPMRIGSKKGSVTSMPGLIPPRAAGGSQSSTPSVSNAPCRGEIRRVGRTIRTCFGKLGLPVGDYLRSRPPQPPLLDAQRDAVHDADVHAGLVADERR